MDARNINQIHDERRTASNDPRDVYDHCAVLRAPVSIFTATNIPRYQPQFGALVGIIEILGEGSARAQGLRSAVTSVQKLMHNLSHRLYVMRSELEVEETEHHAETDVMEEDYQSERVNSLEKAANEIVGVGELNIHELEQQRDTRAPKYKTCKAIGILKVGIKKLFVSVSDSG
ncbi:hypothetical protein HDU79_009817 [Rhizoclosmatium sp. JEL0117]|nr:hypothetical protein HDU79_009817 [Rhizoclosmatium sp. JEL0117]